MSVSKLAGRLCNFIDLWEKFTNDSVILECIKGYKIPFVEPAIQKIQPRALKLSDPEGSEILTAINQLISKGAVSECQPSKNQFVSSYFLIDKSNGQKRFILNLKKLNCFMEPPHFKLEDQKTVMRLLTKNSYMASIDLKDAFHLISIAEEDRKYLRFEFNYKLYQFNCLPFGICTAPYQFTKITKPLVQFLRGQGFMSVIYLDDILLISKSKQDCLVNISVTKETLESLGFIINWEKSCLNPSQEQKFLGFLYNSVTMKVELPLEKKEKILKLTQEFNLKTQCRIRNLTQCIGILVSACPGVRYGWLYTKLMEREKFLALEKVKGNFDKSMKLSGDIKSELQWWIKNVSTANNLIRDSEFRLEIFSDSSLTGWGACCNEQKTHGWWDLNDQKEYINFLELKAAFNALKSFATNYKSCQILLRVDNTTAISYINRMGGVKHKKLHNMAKFIWQWCEIRNIWIFASYIKSKENIVADRESRVLPPETEWELNNSDFRSLVERFGNFEIDLFATNINNKCPKFVSWFKDPESVAIDALTISWKSFYFYAFPPFSLILRVIRKIIDDRSEGVLLVPYWPAQVWYPLFLELLIEEPFFLGPRANLITSPFREVHPLASNLILVAGRLSGKHLKEKE